MALHSRAAPSRRSNRLTTRQAIVLGLVQGPTEVLPMSSSGHLVLVPALLGWPYARLPADTRKAFEVALHLGAGVALAWLLRDDMRAALHEPGETLQLAAPAAVAGVALEPLIEERLSDPRIAAAAQCVAGAALAIADARPPGADARTRKTGLSDLGFGYIGVAQALALVPGVSRNGATLTAARALGADPETASRLSWRAGLPVIAGASALKLVRIGRRGIAPELRAPFAAGAAAAFVSTLASAPLLRVRSHRLTGAYRAALGAVALRRLHRLEWPRG